MPRVEQAEGEWLENGWARKGVLPQAYRPTVFTLPKGYRHPRHYLVIHAHGPGGSPAERQWEVEHDPSCAAEYVGHRVTYRCDVADELLGCGLDYLEADENGAEWTSLPPGRYEIEAWHTSYDGGYDPHECEHGLRVVRRLGAVVATVVSV